MKRTKAARRTQRVTRPPVTRRENSVKAAPPVKAARVLPQRALIHAPLYVSTNKQTVRPTLSTRRKGSPLRVSVQKTLARPKAMRRPELKKPVLETLCGEYNRQRKERRATMFASGSAGKGRRNTGARKADWRRRYC